MHIDDDRSGTFMIDSRIDVFLQAHIYCEDMVIAGLAFIAAQLTNDAAIGVDLNPAVACFAAENLIIGLFDTVLANSVTR